MHSVPAPAEQSAGTTPYPASIERAVGPLRPEVPRPGFYSPVASLCPIGVFDSGLGGLSIVTELRKLMPGEDMIYFADSANCPYGGRSDEWLRARSLEITDFLLERGAKAIVVACNTASAAGLDHVRALRRVPVIGLVPAVKPAVQTSRSRVIGVLATPATIRGRLLSDVIERFATPAGVEVVSVAPEGLVEAVEQGDTGSEETREVVSRALEPMLERGADAIVLGCTHYPFLRPLIEDLTGDGVLTVDSGLGVARHTRHVLEIHRLLNPDPEPGTLIVYTSADPDEVRPLVRRMLGEEVEVRRET